MNIKVYRKSEKLSKNPARRLAMRLAIFAYERCLELNRRGRNISVRAVEESLALPGERTGTTREVYILNWLRTVLHVKGPALDDLAARVIRENKNLLAELELSS